MKFFLILVSFWFGFMNAMAQTGPDSLKIENIKTLIALNSMARDIIDYNRKKNKITLHINLKEDALCLETQKSLINVLANYKFPIFQGYDSYSFNVRSHKLARLDTDFDTNLIRFTFSCYKYDIYSVEEIPFSEQDILDIVESYLGPLSRVTDQEWDQIKASILSK